MKTVADGKVVLALEGGYAVQAVAECAAACVGVLLQHSHHPASAASILPAVAHTAPHENAVRAMREALRVQSRYWKLDPDASLAVPDAWRVKEAPKARRGRGGRAVG